MSKKEECCQLISTSVDNHPTQIAEWIADNIHRKFEAGVKEHGGELRRKPVAAHLREEYIDMGVYLAVKEEQDHMVDILLEIAQEVVGYSDELTLKCIQGARNVKKTGNVYGIMEVELSGEPDKTLSFDHKEQYFVNKEIYEYILGDLEDA